MHLITGMCDKGFVQYYGLSELQTLGMRLMVHDLR